MPSLVLSILCDSIFFDQKLNTVKQFNNVTKEEIMTQQNEHNDDHDNILLLLIGKRKS